MAGCFCVSQPHETIELNPFSGGVLELVRASNKKTTRYSENSGKTGRIIGAPRTDFFSIFIELTTRLINRIWCN